MKIVFFGTSDVGTPILKELGNAHEIALVVTSPDAPVGRKQVITPSPIAVTAQEMGLNISKPEKVKNNPEFLQTLRNVEADIFIVVSYGKILPEALLDIPLLKTLNVHFSMLPKYRGAAPIQYALLNGDTETGTTIFVLDAEVDHGPILSQQPLAIKVDDTFTTLARTLSELSSKLLAQTLPQYAAGQIVPRIQNHELATFTKLIKKDDGRIDWNRTAGDIYNQYRAFIEWPGLWTTYQEKKLKILECAPAGNQNELSRTALLIPCGNNTHLAITKLQLEGRNPATAKDFLNGNPRFMPQDLK